MFLISSDHLWTNFGIYNDWYGAKHWHLSESLNTYNTIPYTFTFHQSSLDATIDGVCIQSPVIEPIECGDIKSYQSISPAIPTQVYSFSNMPFILVEDPMNFADAELYCQQTYGTHLATIYDASDIKLAQSICEQRPIV